MTENIDVEKKRLIEEIIRLQDDFGALTEKSNTLQHENQYFQAQLDDLQAILVIKKEEVQRLVDSAQIQSQQHWPIYIKIEGGVLPQQPGEFVKFQATDGQLYVQYLSLIQHVETSPDGKSQYVVGSQYAVAQEPVNIFQAKYGPLKDICPSQPNKSPSTPPHNKTQLIQHQTQQRPTQPQTETNQ